ncbi:hypothetical protein ACTFIU_003107 [Dictyostelium citrinum]
MYIFNDKVGTDGKLGGQAVDQLKIFSSEVTRVSREVGTEGILGGQAQVEGVGGVWKDVSIHFTKNSLLYFSQSMPIGSVTILDTTRSDSSGTSDYLNLAMGTGSSKVIKG